MNKYVLDVSREVRQADWEKPKGVRLQINPKQGLYLLSFKNLSSEAIHDKNVLKGAISKSGKVVVPANATTIKFGKFENYLKNRLSGYHKHMHYPSDPDCVSEACVFSQHVERVYVFPIPTEIDGSNPFTGARVFENLWNSVINSHLEKNLLLEGAQNNRSEYRNTKDLSAHYSKIESLLGNVAMVIMELRKTINERLAAPYPV